MVTLLVIAVVAVVVRGSVESSFGEYVAVSNMERLGGDLVAQLEAYYIRSRSWDGVDALFLGRGGQSNGNGLGQGQGGRGAKVYIADTDGVIVASTQLDWIGQHIDTIGPSRQIEVYVDERTVGILGEQTPGTLAQNEAERRFLAETTNGLLLTGVAAGLVAVGLGIGLSYSLTRPLQKLTDRISRWRLRDAPEPLLIEGTDEIRRLGAAFNDLLTRLAEGEQQRQRMSADVAHELRTPVTVMRGHLEAMMDGVYPLDALHLAVAYDQVLHLVRLVEDLRLLTQAEAGKLPLNPSPFDLKLLIQAAVERFAPLAADESIRITTHLPNMPAIIYADPHRVQQVLDNLLNNAVRHTSTQGKIEVEVTTKDKAVQVAITNQTGKQLSDDQITHLFDRFWRGEDARERDTGGSGLGLAITRQLLHLQGGDIYAARVDGGLRLVFTLPCENCSDTSWSLSKTGG
ncbi:MAG: ATP-binding protein [Phototrophicaceae bacterium]